MRKIFLTLIFAFVPLNLFASPRQQLDDGNGNTMGTSSNPVHVTCVSGCSGAGGSPGGSDTQVQFNDAGSFGGNAGFIFIKSSGNVGIGSTAPGQKLDVQGTIRSTVLIATGTGDSSFTSNVGIGSASPGKQLDVQGTIRTVNFTMTGNSPAAGSILKSDSVGIGTWAVNLDPPNGIIIDGGGSVITTGFVGCKEFLSAATIVSWTMTSEDAGSPTSGSITLDLWKDTYANWPPTVADTITASAKPAISSATKNTSSTLTGWTTSVSAGDWICWNVDSVTSLKKVIFSMKLKRS